MTAQTRIEEQISKFIFSDPVLLESFCLIDKAPDETIKTVAIDTRSTIPVLRYNTNYINSISNEVLEFILVSEGFKILLRHPTTRLKSPKEVASLASTLTVNNCLNNLSEASTLKPEMFGIDDFRDDAYYEFFFRELMDKMDKIPPTLAKMGMGKGGQGKPEKGDGKGDKSEQQSNKDALKDYMDPSGDNSKYWSENDLFDAEVKETIKANKDSAKSWGKYTGKSVAEIIASITPKISWKDILKKFNTSVMSTKQIQSRMKVNRRMDLAAPGHRRIYKSKVLFAVDVSGSMSDDDLAEAFAVINSTCRHSELSVMQFDTEIKWVDKKWKKAAQKIKVHGRGGTDTQCVIDYAEKESIDGLIIYSDMAFSAPSKPKKTKVLWLGTEKNLKPPVTWGMVANLERNQDTH